MLHDMFDVDKSTLINSINMLNSMDDRTLGNLQMLLSNVVNYSSCLSSERFKSVSFDELQKEALHLSKSNEFLAGNITFFKDISSLPHISFFMHYDYFSLPYPVLTGLACSQYYCHPIVSLLYTQVLTHPCSLLTLLCQCPTTIIHQGYALAFATKYLSLLLLYYPIYVLIPVPCE